MHLLNTTTRQLEFFADGDIPSYAILSHRWGKGEVSFKDMENGNAQKREGYQKIEKTCSIAAAAGLKYAWIDTCCIDKSSSAELSEAINSMYRWYQDAVVCYAYLSDVYKAAVEPDRMFDFDRVFDFDREFGRSEWFRRGWTLQELLAPAAVIFLNAAWEEIGTKLSLQAHITRVTCIPSTILCGIETLDSACVAQRMSWAARRVTTRVEDRAYCLPGLFGVNMPMLYGEGEKAFVRLQEEILKTSDDHSIFAWGESPATHRTTENHPRNALTQSPRSFLLPHIVPMVEIESWPIIYDSQGIHLTLLVGELEWDPKYKRHLRLALLPCKSSLSGGWIALKLAPTEAKQSPNTYKRMRAWVLLPSIHEFSKTAKITKVILLQSRLETNGLPLLARLAKRGDITGIKLVMEKGTDPKCRDQDYGSALFHAALRGQTEVISLFLRDSAFDQTHKENWSRQSLEALWSDGLEEASMFMKNTVILLVQEGLSNMEKERRINFMTKLLTSRGDYLFNQQEMMRMARYVVRALDKSTANEVMKRVIQYFDSEEAKPRDCLWLLLAIQPGLNDIE